MPTTSPDNIRTPNPTDPFNLVADMAITASDTQAALVKRANLYVGTSAQRTAFTSAPEGTHWQDTNGTALEYVRKSGVWRPAVPILRGFLTFNIAEANTSYNQTINFPAGFFALAPTLSLTNGTGTGATTGLNFWVSGTPTINSASISVSRATVNSAQVIHWVATGV